MKKQAPPSEVEKQIRAILARLSSTWESRSVTTVSVAFNSRLRTSLARCRPASRRISLSPRLIEDVANLLEEALCHEAAHVLAYETYGRKARPHGPEWQALVKRAGFAARRAIPGIPDEAPRPAKVEKIYEHRCPVCQSVRFARRRMTNWRCLPCREAGFDGGLVISGPITKGAAP